MSGNTIGHLFTVTTAGESHGPGLVAIVDGTPPRIPLTEADLQIDLDRRKPGQSQFTTQRREDDRVEILSGVFEGVTTGTPIGLLIRNEDQRSRITVRSPMYFGQHTPTTPMRTNMACGITAAVDAVQRERPPCESRQAPLQNVR